MKKKATLLLTQSAILCTTAMAQKIGVRAGINISNITTSGSGLSTSASASDGFNAAVFLETHLASIVYLQPEVGFSQMGAQQTISTSGASSTVKDKTDYLAIPVLLKVKVPLTGLAAYVGPQYSILLSANETSEGVSQDVKSNYKSGDFAGVVGIEYSLKFGLGLSARYQAGFSNIANDATNGFTAKNHTFTFSVEFKL